MNLNKHLNRQRDWSFQTFGPPRGSAGVIDHIKKEIIEVEETPEDLYEWIDIVILAFDGAFRMGFTSEEIIDALSHKQQINEHRKWPDWKTATPGKAIEHIDE